LLEFYVLVSKALRYHSLFSVGENSILKCRLANPYTSAPCHSRFPRSISE
jgi:hypothetical protein